MPTGGFNPFPRRFGGGASRTQTFYEALNQGRGSAYDTSDGSNVTAETMAEARALAGLWSANRRLSLQWDPARMTDMLPRWEKIFGIIPLSTDSMHDRRARLAVAFQRLVGPLASTVADAAQTILDDAYVATEYTPLASAKTGWPGGSPPESDEWFSSVAHILIRVSQTSTQTVSEFLTLMGKLTALLDDFLPAWATHDWGTYAANGMNGFYLDENNLDYETFDS